MQLLGIRRGVRHGVRHGPGQGSRDPGVQGSRVLLEEEREGPCVPAVFPLRHIIVVAIKKSPASRFRGDHQPVSWSIGKLQEKPGKSSSSPVPAAVAGARWEDSHGHFPAHFGNGSVRTDEEHVQAGDEKWITQHECDIACARTGLVHPWLPGTRQGGLTTSILT